MHVLGFFLFRESAKADNLFKTPIGDKMRLQYKGNRPFVVFIKTPEFYLKSVAPDETLEVSDQIAAAILCLYGSDFEAIIEKVERRNKKVVDYTEVK